MANYDARALRVARLVQERVRPEFAILFGSRARGDHDELTSDIDLMLALAVAPGADERQAADREAQQATQATYGRAVPVQLTWRTLADFRHSRRYTNSVGKQRHAGGHRHITPPGKLPRRRLRGRGNRVRIQLGRPWESPVSCRATPELLEVTAERGMNDLLIGQEAQRTLEHGLKALIAAHGAEYPKIHNIGALLGAVREQDPRMRNFRLGIPAEVYSEYAGEDAYQEQRIRPKLTEHADYLAQTRASAQFIIERAKAYLRTVTTGR